MDKGSNQIKNEWILSIKNIIPLIKDNTLYAKFDEISWINNKFIHWKLGRIKYIIIPSH